MPKHVSYEDRPPDERPRIRKGQSKLFPFGPPRDPEGGDYAWEQACIVTFDEVELKEIKRVIPEVIAPDGILDIPYLARNVRFDPSALTISSILLLHAVIEKGVVLKRLRGKSKDHSGPKRGRPRLSKPETQLACEILIAHRNNGVSFDDCLSRYENRLEDILRRKWQRGPKHVFDRSVLKDQLRRLYDTARKWKPERLRKYVNEGAVKGG